MFFDILNQFLWFFIILISVIIIIIIIYIIMSRPKKVKITEKNTLKSKNQSIQKPKLEVKKEIISNKKLNAQVIEKKQKSQSIVNEEIQVKKLETEDIQKGSFIPSEDESLTSKTSENKTENILKAKSNTAKISDDISKDTNDSLPTVEKDFSVEDKPLQKATLKPIKQTNPMPVKTAVSKPIKKASSKSVKKSVEKPKTNKKRETGKFHVLYRKEDNKWYIKREGNDRIVKILETQREAIAFATIKSINQKTSMVVHKRDGKIRKQNY